MNKRTLQFPPFQPSATEKKDFSELVEIVRSTQCYRERTEDIDFGRETAFIRGSILAFYEGGGVVTKAHKHSDIDLYATRRDAPGDRVIYQHDATVPGEDGSEEISIDLTTLDRENLEREIKGEGEEGLLGLNDFILISTPTENEPVYESLRDGALFAYLRLGLGHQHEEYDAVTPSGAAQAINDGLLTMNGLRWWSVENYYKESPTAEQNKLHFLDAVERMLYGRGLSKIDKKDGEPVYRVPRDLPLRKDSREIWKERLPYYAGKISSRFHTWPPATPEDVRKLAYKLKTYGIGKLGGKEDMEEIFSEEREVSTDEFSGDN